MKEYPLRAFVSLCLLVIITAFRVDIAQAIKQSPLLDPGDCTKPDLCPIPPSPTQLIRNGGFNNYALNSKIPTRWTAINFGAADGKATTVKTEGTASIKMVGAPGKIKTIKQAINLSGSNGELFTMVFHVKGKSIPLAAGACRVQLLFYNGQILMQTKTVECQTGTYAFSQQYLQFTSQTEYTKIVARITYSKSSGTVWFDGLQLLK